jgi:hypothetical protein
MQCLLGGRHHGKTLKSFFYILHRDFFLNTHVYAWINAMLYLSSVAEETARRMRHALCRFLFGMANFFVGDTHTRFKK